MASVAVCTAPDVDNFSLPAAGRPPPYPPYREASGAMIRSYKGRCYFPGDFAICRWCEGRGIVSKSGVCDEWGLGKGKRTVPGYLERIESGEIERDADRDRETEPFEEESVTAKGEEQSPDGESCRHRHENTTISGECTPAQRAVDTARASVQRLVRSNCMLWAAYLQFLALR